MFTPTQTRRIVPGTGNLDAKICIIGDLPGTEDDRCLRPFAGASGTVLESCLHAAGLTKMDCYLTNVIKVRPRNGDTTSIFNPRTGAFTQAGVEWLDYLATELRDVRANVLVPFGALAMAALVGRSSVSKFRGYVTETLRRYGSRKAIPTYHPSATLRGQYLLRYYITADLRKAKIESSQPEIIRPDRRIVVPTTLSECLEWLDYINEQPAYACDIEVVNFEVSAIGFATSPQLAVSIPFYHEHWTEDEELVLWNAVAKILENPKIRKLFQNGIFDIQFLFTRCGIRVADPIEDSMIAHSVMYPEMLKGLGFLGSMYCGSQEYWKDAVKWENIKEEA